MSDSNLYTLRLLIAATFLIAGFISGAIAGKRRFSGPEYWTVGNYAVALSAFAATASGLISAPWSQFLSGVLLSAGCGAFAHGMRVFHGRKTQGWLFIAGVGLLTLGMAWGQITGVPRISGFLEVAAVALACVDLAHSAQNAGLPRSRGVRDVCAALFLCGAAIGGLRSASELLAPARVLGIDGLAIDVSHQAWFILFSVGWTYYQIMASSDRYEAELDFAVAGLRAEVELRKSAETALKAEISRDFLTGAANRRKFFEEACRWVALCRRHSLPLSVIMLDIDDFKLFNDRHGHAAGDEALKVVAARLAESLRTEDLLARYGGEEFVILLPETDLEQALQVAEKLCRVVNESCVPATSFSGPGEERHGFGLKLTCSFGVAGMRPGEDNVQSVIDRADAAMYHAKRSGKARVYVAAEGPGMMTAGS